MSLYQSPGQWRGLPRQPARLAGQNAVSPPYQCYATADAGLIAYENALARVWCWMKA